MTLPESLQLIQDQAHGLVLDETLVASLIQEERRDRLWFLRLAFHLRRASASSLDSEEIVI